MKFYIENNLNITEGGVLPSASHLRRRCSMSKLLAQFMMRGCHREHMV